ncbi:MAG: hypothetical protein LBR37_00135 [Erysipelotrichaceae bacterium]|jgi:hypothetical protein|nr:hypothetical protein [Erysipelotrichaceae bacterium]
MKKKALLLNSITLTSILVACGSNPFDDAIAFLDKYDAAFYYCGNESTVFSKISGYHELSGSDFPEEYPLFSAFVIDVQNKCSVITKDFLNEIFSAFYQDTYVYVMFINYSQDLSFLADSYFSYEWPDYNERIDADLVIFYNDGKHDYLSTNFFTFTYTFSSDYTTENYHKSIIQTYYSFVKNALIVQ